MILSRVSHRNLLACGIAILVLLSACATPKPADHHRSNTANDEVLVGAYWYPWFGAGGRHWDEGYLGTPTLGEYDMTRPGVLNRHVEWAAGHAIDFFAASWWGPGSFEDEVLRDYLPAATSSGAVRFAVLYESTGLLQREDGRFNMDIAANRRRFVDDVRYLAETFFERPDYLRIDGRPVLFVYLTRIFSGDVAGAFDEARAAVRQIDGHEPYIVADEVYWDLPDAGRLPAYDAVTAYNMHRSVPRIEANFASKVLRQYRRWARTTRRIGVNLVPDVLPGFDDTAVRPDAGHPIIGRSVELFGEQLAGSLDIARRQPVPMVMITSWNEWHEYTSIEPAEEYGFDYLKVLRDQLEAR